MGLNRSASLLVMLMVVTSPIYIIYLGSGKTEPFVMAYSMAVIFAMIHLNGSSSRAVLLGLLSGLSVLAKLSGAYFVLPGVACFILLKFWGEWKLVARQIMGVALGGLVTLLFLFLQNWLLFDEPLSPLYSFSSNKILPLALMANPRFIVPEVATKIWALFPFSFSFGRFPAEPARGSALWFALLPFVFFAIRQKGKIILRDDIFIVFLSGMAGLFVWYLIFPTNFMLRLFVFSTYLLMPLPAYGWMIIE